MLEKLKELYPNRYYCNNKKPAGFYDMWIFSKVEGLPSLDDLNEVSKEDWDKRMATRHTNLSHHYFCPIEKKLKDYVHPEPSNERKAKFEMDWIKSEATMCVAMGTSFSDEMKEYVKTIKEILDGKNLEIPKRPSNIFAN